MSTSLIHQAIYKPLNLNLTEELESNVIHFLIRVSKNHPQITVSLITA
jgi:hypothetical protein